MVPRLGFPLLILFGIIPLVMAQPTPAPVLTPEGTEYFEKKVRPILVNHCYACHSAGANKIKGELRVDTRDGLLKGGSSGPAIVPGQPQKSLLMTAIRHANDAPKMPPDRKLSAAEIADLEAWVRMGAPDPRTGATTTGRLDPSRAQEFWSFVPVKDAPIPPVKDAAWPVNAVDRFILAKLEAKGLSPAPLAEKRTLLRRVTFDLIGLPPTPDEIDAFDKDNSPEAYVKVVERLLASPHYGERWGRHWLDVVRYSDTAGDNSDYPIPQIYRYRNWVIDAFNRDLPYDEFVRHQLAGDLLPASNESDRQARLIATGYLANTRRFGSYEDARYQWYLTYEDSIDNFGKAFLGLTIGCCRCHDHKFDPLSQADYYALYGFFQSTRYPWPGIELDKVQRDFVPLAPPDRIAAFERERKQKFDAFDVKIAALEVERTATGKELVAAEKTPDEAERKLKVSEANKRLDALKAKIKAAQTEREQFRKQPLPFDTAYAVAEGQTEGKRKVGNACIHIKGDPERIGAEVPRRFPTALGGQQLPANVAGSGRLHLARWVTDPKNPLFARVMVNRIWQHHFGTGIVRTPGNFGALGQSPTHPELLDYLSSRFIESGWSVKAMHRLIVLSRTYRMSSGNNDANVTRDATNEWRWRSDRRRLDAESIRDSMLAVGGNLNRTPGGPHPFPEMSKWNFTQHNPFKAVYDTDRRSVYLMAQRIQRHPFLALFDGPDANASTADRPTSTTPLQALFMMNDPFVHTQARYLAARLQKEHVTESERIRHAFLLLYGRPPAAEESEAVRAHLNRVRETLRNKSPANALDLRAWESVCRALFLSNEFIYVD